MEEKSVMQIRSESEKMPLGYVNETKPISQAKRFINQHS